MVSSVVSGSPAERAGLLAGDEVVNFNGENVPRRAERWLRNKNPGDTLKLRLLRNEKPLDIALALGGKAESIFAIAEDPQASAKARAIRDGMLHGMTGAAKAASTAVH